MNFLSVLYAKAGITVDGVTELNNTATALTPTTSDSSTKIATTAFVKNQNYYPYPTGTTSQYVRGDGSLATFPTVAAEAKTLITEVYNETGATLTKGTVVYINGGHGNLPTITKALANSDATSAQTYGVVQNDITDNNNGFVVVIGSLIDLDTFAYANGTILYLSPTTAGAWTSTKPYAPQHIVYVGIVVRSHPTQGVVEIKIQNGYEMDELHNVSAQSPANGDILQFNFSTQLWTKTAGTTTNIAEGTNLYFTDARARAAITLTTTGTSGAATYSGGVLNIPQYQAALTNPVTGTGTTNYLPKFTGTSSIGNSQIFDNGTSVGIGTATPNASYKLDINGGVHISSGNFYRYATDVGIIGSGTSITGGLATQLGIRSSSDILFSTGGSTERMRINSVGNLGLGITPSTATGRFIQFGAGAALSTNNTNNSNFWHNTTFDASGNTLYAVTGQQSSFYRQINGQHQWFYAAAGTSGNAITFTQHMTLDALGQLGLGVTPSAWSGFKAFQTVGGSVIGAAGELQLWQNAYFDGASKYYATGTATRYGMTAGQHRWYNAISGSANAALTWVQAMTLAASGNFLIGTTTDAGYKLDVNGTARVSGRISTTGGTSNDVYTQYTTIADITNTNDYVLRFNNNAGSQIGYIGIISSGGVFQYNNSNGHNFTGAATFSSSVTTGGNIILPDSQDISWGAGGYGAYKPTISATDGVGIKFYPDGQGSGNTFTINTNGTATFSSSVTTGGNATFGLGANRPVTYDTNGGNFRINGSVGGWATGYFFNGSSGTFRGGFGGYGGADALTYYWIGNDYNTATVYVDPNSNRVGIGTDSPFSKLHIKGTNTTLTITDTSYNRTSEIGYLDAANLYFANDSASNTFIGRYNNVFLAYSGGNVVIGSSTSYHSSKLTVGGSVFFQQAANSDIGGRIYGYHDTSAYAYEGGLKFQTFKYNGSGYTMTDFLTVKGSGAATFTSSVTATSLRAQKSQTNGDYTTAAIWTESYSTTTTGIAFHINGTVGKFLEMRTNGILYWDGNTIITSGNIGSQTAGSAYSSNAVNITGYGVGNFTYYQTDGTFSGYTGWAGYLISNHGDGATYYNQTIILPFWGAPKYSRKQGGVQQSVYTFWTDENLVSPITASNVGTYALPIGGGTVTGSITATDFYTAGWFRNSTANKGLFNSAYNTHLYSRAAGVWSIASSNSALGYLELWYKYYDEVGAEIKGSLAWDSAGFGLLNNEQSEYSVRCNQGSSYGGTLKGDWNIDGANLSINSSASATYANITYSSSLDPFGEHWYSGMAHDSGADETYYYIYYSDGNQFRLYADGTIYINGGAFSQYTATSNYISVGAYGLYSSTYSAYFRRNDASSYAAWELVGAKGGYTGMYYSASNQPHIMFNTSNGNGGLYYQTNSRWILYYDYGNNSLAVGGTTSSASYKMYVTGAIYATGAIVANSDGRNKENVELVENALDKVNSLRGVTYTKKDQDSGKREMGVIAQEVLPHVPEVIQYAEDLDQYGVSYGNFAGLFIEAIKEQQVLINELKSEIEILKNK